MSARTKLHIQQSFYTLLQTTNFSDIHVQNICDQAMIHRSTFYRYYPDKYILLNAVLEKVIQDMYQTLPVLDSNIAMITHFLDQIEKNLAFLKHISVEDSNGLYESLHQFISKTLVQNASIYNDVLSLKIKNTKTPELLGRFYSSGIREIFNIWIHDRTNTYTKDDMIELILEITK